MDTEDAGAAPAAEAAAAAAAGGAASEEMHSASEPMSVGASGGGAGSGDAQADAQSGTPQQQPPQAEAQAPQRGAGLDHVTAAAAAAGIDLAFLEALPSELWLEVLAAQGVQVPPQRPPPPAAQPVAAPEPTAAPPAPTEPAAAAAAEAAPAAEAGAVTASAAAEGTSTAPAAPAAPAAPPAAAPAAAMAEEEEEEAIDPEFLAALPPDIREELLQQQRQERVRRRREAERAAGAAAAAAAAPAGGDGAAAAPAQPAAAELDLASLLATFPPDVREEVLLTSDDALLATLPPAIMAEAQALRERHMRHFARARMELPTPPLPRMGAGAAGGAEFGAAGFPRTGLARRTVPVAGAGHAAAAERLAGSAAARAAAGAGAAETPDGPPLLTEAELVVLVQLLRSGQPMSKVQLQKLFLNLAHHSVTRASMLGMLLALLRAIPGAATPPAGTPPTAEGASGQEGEGGGVQGMDTSGEEEAGRSLAAALDQLGAEAGGDPSGADSTAAAAGDDAAGAAAPAAAAAGAAAGSTVQGGGQPAVLTRRVLDMLTHLARHNARAARLLLTLSVSASTGAVLLAPPAPQPPVPAADAKGKAPAQPPASSSLAPASPSPGSATAAAPELRGMEVVMGMLDAPLCKRSMSMLETVLQLLETVLLAAQRHTAQLNAQAAASSEANEYVEAGTLAGTARLVNRYAAAAAGVDAASIEGVRPPFRPVTAADALAWEQAQRMYAGDSAQGGGEAALAARGEALQHYMSNMGAARLRQLGLRRTAPAAEYAVAVAAEAAGGGAAGGASTSATAASSSAAPAAGSSAAAAGSGDASSSAGTSASSAAQPPPERLDALLEPLPPHLLRQLPALLSRESLSEAATSRLNTVLRLLAATAPSHLPLLLSELQAGLTSVAGETALVLDAAAARGIDADSGVARAVSGHGGVVLRLLQAVATVQKDLAKNAAAAAAREDHEAGAHDIAVEELKSLLRDAGGDALVAAVLPEGSAAVARPAPAPSAEASAAALTAAQAQLSSAVDALAVSTEPMWSSLSACIGAIEDTLKLPAGGAAAGARGEAGGNAAAARLLPPGAQQVLPLVEAFFVLCALTGAIPPPLQASADLLTAPSAAAAALAAAAAAGAPGSGAAAMALGGDSSPPASQEQLALARAGSSGAIAAAAGAWPSSSGGPQPPQQQHASFLRFSERHRRLLNAYLRRNHGLLESSLAPLLRAPKLIDFDNKRAWFRWGWVGWECIGVWGSKHPA